MTNSIVAKNYAKALFFVAKKQNLIESISNQVEIFKQNFSTSFARELKNPAISKNSSKQIIFEISKGLKIEGVFADFLVVLASNKRLNIFSNICFEFLKLVKIEKNILEIELISKEKLEESQIKSAKSLIEKNYLDKKIEIKETIKEDILGGLQIKVGSKLIDASLKNQIAKINQKLILAIN